MAGYPRYTGAGDIFDSLDQVANVFTGAYNKYKEEEAQYELNSMKNKLDTDINNKLNELRESDNWENWEEEMDKFLEEKNSSLSDKDSAYYCKNEYTAKRAKMMIDNSRPALQQKVHEMQWGKKRDHYLEMYNQDLIADKNNGVPAQDRMNRAVERLKSLKSMGMIDEPSYNKEVDRLYSSIYIDSVTTAVSDMFETGIAADKDFNAIWNDFNKENPDVLKKYGENGLELAVDKSELNKMCKKQLESEYNAAVKDIQNKNSLSLAQIYENMEAAKTESEKQRWRDEGNRLLKQFKGLQLSEASSVEYAYKFRNTIDKPSKGSGSGSGSGGGSDEQGKLFDDLAKKNTDTWVAEVAAGRIKPEAAKETLWNILREELLSGHAKDYKPNSVEEADNIIEQYTFKYFQEFYGRVVDAALDPKKFASTNALLKKLTTEISNHPDDYGGPVMGFINEQVVDLIVSNNTSNYNDAELYEQISKWANSIYGARIEALQSKLQTVEGTNYFDYKNDKQRKEYLSTAAALGEDNDVMYSDENGVIHFKSEADKEAVQKYEDNARLEVARSIGVNPEDLKVTYKKDKYGDEIPVPEFTAKNGNKYHLEAVKDKNGKAVDYKIVSANGMEVKSYDYDKMKKEANKKAAAESKAAAAAKKAAASEEHRLWADRQKAAEKKLAKVTVQPKAVKGLDDGVWYGMDAKDKFTYIKNAIADCTTDDKLAKEVAGMSAEEFSKLPWEKQLDIVIKQ